VTQPPPSGLNRAISTMAQGFNRSRALSLGLSSGLPVSSLGFDG
jgi:hypothetical protein